MQRKNAKQAGEKVCKQYSKAGLPLLLITFPESTEQISKSSGPQGNWAEGGGPGSHVLSVLLAGETYSLP